MKATDLPILPIFDQIMADGQLPARQLQVWRELSKHLDVSRPRRIPFEKVAPALGMDRSSLIRHVASLIERGYVVREDGLYRIPLSREIAKPSTIAASNDDERDPDDMTEVVARKARGARQRINDRGVL